MNVKMWHAKETNSHVQIKTSLPAAEHIRETSSKTTESLLMERLPLIHNKTDLKIGKDNLHLSMFELFHVFYMFYLFSEHCVSGTWKSRDLCHLSKKKKQWDESSMFHIHNSTILKISFFLFCVFSDLLVNVSVNKH